MDVSYRSWLPNLTNDPHKREKVSVIPRFFAVIIAVIFIVTIGMTVFNVKEVVYETDYFSQGNENFSFIQ